MEKEILKKIDAAIRPQIKTDLAEIQKLQDQLKAMVEQQAIFTGRLETANQEIKALDAEVSALLAAFAAPEKIERAKAELRQKKQTAEDMAEIVKESGPDRQAGLRQAINDAKRECAARAGGLLSGIHAECCTEMNRKLQAVLDYHEVYAAAVTAFCREVDIPIDPLGVRKYLRTEGRTGADIERMPGFSTIW